MSNIRDTTQATETWYKMFVKYIHTKDSTANVTVAATINDITLYLNGQSQDEDGSYLRSVNTTAQQCGPSRLN